MKMKKLMTIITLLGLSVAAQAEWNVDFSRRTKELRRDDYNQKANTKKEKSIFEHVFESSAPVQEVVLLNTEKGFMPANFTVHQGVTYRVHLVNINEKARNVSFIMDSFSEHHATYYGKLKTFTITPKKEGIFTFQCPETSAQGRLVVMPRRNKPMHGVPDGVEMRTPASEGE